MKQISQILLFAAIILTLVACSSTKTEDTVALTQIESNDLGVTIGHPEGWTVKNEPFGIAMTDMDDIEFTFQLQQLQKDIDGTAIVLWQESTEGVTEQLLSMSPEGIPAFMLPSLARQFNGTGEGATETTWLGLEALTLQEMVTLNEKELEVTYTIAHDPAKEKLYYIIALDSTHTQDELIQAVTDTVTLK